MQHYALEGDTRTKNTIVTSAITINIKVKKRNKTKKGNIGIINADGNS